MGENNTVNRDITFAGENAPIKKKKGKGDENFWDNKFKEKILADKINSFSI